MIRAFWLTLLTIILSITISGNVVGRKRILIPKVPARVAKADCICVGNVLRLEPKLVKLSRYPGGPKVDHQIAIVKVTKAMLVPNQVTHLRVAIQSAARSRAGGYGFGELSAGNTVCLFLQSQPGTSLYQPRQFYDVIGKKHPNFKKEVAQAEKHTKFLRKPMEALKNKDARERLLTAMMLITRYRTAQSAKNKEVPIDAKESALILQALAKADWKKDRLSGYSLNPRTCFYMLGLSQADGWTSPREYKQQIEAAKRWLQINANKYRIKKWVPVSN